MKPTQSTLHRYFFASACSLVLAACGGGGGSPGTTTATDTTGAQAAVYDGPIMGYGSVIVNGMRFSSVGAVMQDDDGQSVTLAQLKLGMTVHIEGVADQASGQGRASRVELVHGTRGVVTGISTSTGTLTVNGQTINTNSSTAYQGVTGLAALTVGQTVEVFGAAQTDGSLLASLIEVKAPQAAVSLVGRISALTGTTFNVGTLTVNYATAVVDGVLVDGKRVRVKAASGPVANVLTASAVRVSAAAAVGNTPVATGTRMKVKGVADAAPVNGLLTVSGTPIDVSKAVIQGGATLSAGQLLEVFGIWDGKVLQATRVEVEGFREHQMGGRNELFGAVSSVTGTTAVVDGVTVDLSTAMFSNGGTLAQVVVGVYVEIKGNMVGDKLVATRVELKSASGAEGVGFEQFGLVTDFVSISNFKLNGMTVDATTAVFEHGVAADVVNGAYIEIRGAKNAAGVFVATLVEIEKKKV
jgi:Domain of unknown function (DUF5666)